ncbi:trimethylguanosine synthase [Plasmodium brasilianum]|uniref:Trimethylguanosine synthase n=2 Tax=Plasmodium (Plasmodium) TaxID=418103 RepID=A0A1A8WAW5_PLAMA|nr:trimethylguanosine synthase, putative [Plasmodium malariae]KAI4835558.1 trimethylguanosine synthase [Plasmodium brasilianum]SBS89129.1 trimethylguanosine synthase, putative [Plasmodium malariae]SCP02481.1 trimethylguanosine synthase, putative [Plasmodium malariae]
MIKIKYNRFNDARNNDENLYFSFLVHPLYYTVLDLDEDDLVNKEIRSNFIHFVKRINNYDKKERIDIYRKDDRKARELCFIKSCELLKNTYKFKMPIIFQNLKYFNLFKKDTIYYYSINYNERRKEYIVRNKNEVKKEKDKCFILDNEMIYSMTPEYISKNIGNNVLLINEINFQKKKKMKKNCENDIGLKNYFENNEIYNNKQPTIEKYFKDERENKYNKAKDKSILIYLDPFSGAGGNCHSMRGVFTIAADVKLIRIKECQHNCKFYNNNVDYILCDFFNIVNHFRKDTIDVVFLSIPWGGPSYKMKKNFDLKYIESKISTYSCLKESLKLTKNLIFYLPRNVCLQDLLHLYVYYEKLTKLKGTKKKRRGKLAVGGEEVVQSLEEREEELVERGVAVLVEQMSELGAKLDESAGVKKQRKEFLRDNIFLELYVNRNRSRFKESCDNSLRNFYYFFNKLYEKNSNESHVSNIKNLFKITVDQCNHYLRPSKENRMINTQLRKGRKRQDYVSNIHKYKVNFLKSRDVSNDHHNSSIKKKSFIWRWHNTGMVLYLGKIASLLKRKKGICYDQIYYIHNKLAKCGNDKIRQRGINFSLHRLLHNKRKSLLYNISKRIKEGEGVFYGEKLIINKNEKMHNFIINNDNVMSLYYFVNKKSYEIINYIVNLFFKNIKNIIGFQKISFLNNIFIYIENKREKIMTKKLRNNKITKKYETYIYQDIINICTGLEIVVSYFNMIIMKIKKEIIVLFGIYLYDISFLKYFFKYYKVPINLKKVPSRNLKNIHYIIIRILFKFFLYMNIFLNILTNNIKLQEFFNSNFVNIGSLDFLEFSDIKNKEYSYINYSNKKELLIYFNKFIKRIVQLSINIELNGKKFVIEKITKFFFSFLFKVHHFEFLLDGLRDTCSYEDEKKKKFYKLNLCLITINLFTKQFLYNTNVTSFLDYFNSLIYFYFNRIYVLSRRHATYSNVFVFHLNRFLVDHFCLHIL